MYAQRSASSVREAILGAKREKHKRAEKLGSRQVKNWSRIFVGIRRGRVKSKVGKLFEIERLWYTPSSSKMSVHVAEKNSTLKDSNGLIAENEDDDWQNGQNILVMTQDTHGKELISLSDSQTINVDTYCSYIFWIYLLR